MLCIQRSELEKRQTTNGNCSWVAHRDSDYLRTGKSSAEEASKREPPRVLCPPRPAPRPSPRLSPRPRPVDPPRLVSANEREIGTIFLLVSLRVTMTSSMSSLWSWSFCRGTSLPKSSLTPSPPFRVLNSAASAYK